VEGISDHSRDIELEVVVAVTISPFPIDRQINLVGRRYLPTRMKIRAVLRGFVAGLSGVGFVLIFLFAQTGLVSLPVLLTIGIVTIVALFAAGGRTAVLRLAGRTEPTTDEKRETEWWLSRVEPALEDSWNAWSDLVLTVCLGAVGIGSFALLVTSSSDDPPLGLLITGFLGLNGALISLAFALD